MAKLTTIENVRKSVVYAVVCDGCHKQGKPDDPGWYDFSSGHSGWGNDSVESYNHHDVCSFACYVRVIRERVEHWDDEPTLTIDHKDAEFLKGLLGGAST